MQSVEYRAAMKGIDIIKVGCMEQLVHLCMFIHLVMLTGGSGGQAPTSPESFLASDNRCLYGVLLCLTVPADIAADVTIDDVIGNSALGFL